MDLNSDITRYAIPHQCSQCTYYYDCHYMCYKTSNPQCRRFIPDNINMFLNDTILYFRLNYPRCKDKKLKRVANYHGAYNDRVTTLDDYYVNFINDSIGELRRGKTVYVFKLSQMWEIVRFCPDITATYQGDGIIALCQNHNIKSKI